MRWPVVILAFLMVFLYRFGMYSVIRYFVQNPETLFVFGLFFGVVGEVILGNLQTATYLLIGLIGVTIISIPLIIKAMAKFGKEVITFVMFTPPFILIVRARKGFSHVNQSRQRISTLLKAEGSRFLLEIL